MNSRSLIVAVGIFLAVGGLLAQFPFVASLGCFVGLGAIALLVHKHFSWPYRKVALISAWILGTLLLVFVIYDQHERRVLRENIGILIPGDLPDVKGACGNTAEPGLRIIWGNGETLAKSFPRSIVRVAGKDLLWVDRLDTGAISVGVSLFDDRNEEIARIENGNEFWTRPDVRIRRPDRHRLTVFDRRGEQVLEVGFLNKRSMVVKGVFRYAGRKLVIDQQSIRAGNTVIAGYCAINASGVDINVD